MKRSLKMGWLFLLLVVVVCGIATACGGDTNPPKPPGPNETNF